VGFHPEMILAGRRLNDSMANYVAGQIVKLMAGKKILAKGSKIIVYGLTFKENCPDLRNSKVADVVRELKNYGAKVDVYDPWIDRDEAHHEYGIRPVKTVRPGSYDAAVLAVSHKEFREQGIGSIRKACKKTHVVYDIKYLFPAAQVDGRL
jgi:UDP-N-acetyl-D-galactosamine dehydrogenase